MLVLWLWLALFKKTQCDVETTASIGIATAGSAFFATLRSGGSFAGAYRSGVIVMSAIVVAALLLALIDRHRAAAPAARQKSV